MRLFLLLCFLYMELSNFGILVRSTMMLGGVDSQGGVDGKIGRKGLSLRRLCRWGWIERRGVFCGQRAFEKIGRFGY